MIQSWAWLKDNMFSLPWLVIFFRGEGRGREVSALSPLFQLSFLWPSLFPFWEFLDAGPVRWAMETYIWKGIEREREGEGEGEKRKTERERVILRNWLMLSWELASACYLLSPVILMIVILTVWGNISLWFLCTFSDNYWCWTPCHAHVCVLWKSVYSVPLSIF